MAQRGNHLHILPGVQCAIKLSGVPGSCVLAAKQGGASTLASFGKGYRNSTKPKIQGVRVIAKQINSFGWYTQFLVCRFPGSGRGPGQRKIRKGDLQSPSIHWEPNVPVGRDGTKDAQGFCFVPGECGLRKRQYSPE